jgi:hypothetical protein
VDCVDVTAQKLAGPIATFYKAGKLLLDEKLVVALG